MLAQLHRRQGRGGKGETNAVDRIAGEAFQRVAEHQQRSAAAELLLKRHDGRRNLAPGCLHRRDLEGQLRQQGCAEGRHRGIVADDQKWPDRHVGRHLRRIKRSPAVAGNRHGAALCQAEAASL